jgi:hypothetical protein
MKRPEETDYPTPEKELKRFKSLIESHIDKNVFEFEFDECFDIKNHDLTEWLREWGWCIKCLEPDPREVDQKYFYSLIPN